MNTRHDAWYWIFAAGIPLVFILTAVRVIARRTGSPAAGKWFIPLALVAVLFILGQTGYDLLSATAQRRLSIGFFLLMSLFGWALFIHSAWRQRQAGELLLDLGPPEASRRRIIVGFILLSSLLAVRSGLNWAETGLRSVGSLSETLMWTTATLFWLSVLRSRLRITELGIAPFGEFIDWERVLGYEWVGEERQRLLLRVRRRIPFVGERPGLLAVPVSPPDRHALTAILAQHASDVHTD